MSTSGRPAQDEPHRSREDDYDIADLGRARRANLRVRTIDAFGTRVQVARITVIWWRVPTYLAASLVAGPPPGRDFGSGSTWVEPDWERCPANPTEGRWSVSTEQRENLEAILRQSAFPAGVSVSAG